MKYELLEILPDGREKRRYPNGDIRDNNGRLIQIPERVTDMTITDETSAHFRQLRQQKMLKAIENGLMRVTDAPNPSEAVAHIVSKRAEIAMTDNGRAGNDAAKIVLAAIDALPDRRHEQIQTQRHEYTIDKETMRIVEEMIRMRRDGYTKENNDNIE